MALLKKNIAVIGCGYWGQNLVRSVADLGALYAVSDADAGRAEKFAGQYNVKALSFEDALKDPEVSGVILATPAPAHAKMTLAALAAGKHVMAEKPIALNNNDAQAMVDAAANAKKVLQVGHVLQYHPAFIALKGMVDSGKLGNLRNIYSNRLNFGKVRTEENVWWSFAPHDVSMVLALAGREPAHIAAHFSCGIPGSDIASTALANFDFGQGLTGHIHVSWNNPFKEQKLTVIGEAGMAVFDDTLGWDKKLAFHKNSVTFENGQPVLNKSDVEYVALTEVQPLKEECAHFASCMASGDTPRTDGREGLRVLKVMQAVEAAAKQ